MGSGEIGCQGFSDSLGAGNIKHEFRLGVPVGDDSRGVRCDHGVKSSFDDHPGAGLTLQSFLAGKLIHSPKIEQGRALSQNEAAVNQCPGPWVRLPFGMDVHHAGHQGAYDPVIDDDELQSNQKREPILVQHDHGHHDEEMKVQFDSSFGEMHQKRRGRQ